MQLSPLERSKIIYHGCNVKGFNGNFRFCEEKKNHNIVIDMYNLVHNVKTIFHLQ